MDQPPKEKVQWLLLLAILLFGLGLRMYRVTAPPDDFQAWRCTQTLMVARNFHREGMNLFSPSVDWRSTLELTPKGTVGVTELQVTPYLTACLYHFLGAAHWVGRVVPLLFSLLGILLFHRLAARFQGETRATLAALLLTVSPYYLYLGRCQMPEAFAFTMLFAALLAYHRWLESGLWRHYLPAAAFSLLMLLGKPQIGVMILPMAYLTFAQFKWRTFTQGKLYLFALLAGLPFAAYLFWSYHVLVNQAHLSFAGPTFFQFARWLKDPEYYRSILSAVWWQSITPGICVLGLIGLLLPPYTRRGFFPHAWLAGAIALFLIFPAGTAPNGYYQLILAPPFALLAARTLAPAFNKRRYRPWAGLLLAAVTAYAVATSALMFLPTTEGDAHRRCGEWINENTPRETLVLTRPANPACLYFADRVGWTSWQEHHDQPAKFGADLINRVLPLGATVLAAPDTLFEITNGREKYSIRDLLHDTYACHKDAGFTVFFLDQDADLSVREPVQFGTPDARKYLRGMPWADRLDEQGIPCTIFGAAPSAAIRIHAPHALEQITLELASAAADQSVTIRVNGQRIGGAELPNANQRAQIDLENLPQPADGAYTITLEATSRTPQGHSLLLYNMRVHPEVPENENAPQQIRQASATATQKD